MRGASRPSPTAGAARLWRTTPRSLRQLLRSRRICSNMTGIRSRAMTTPQRQKVGLEACSLMAWLHQGLTEAGCFAIGLVWHRSHCCLRLPGPQRRLPLEGPPGCARPRARDRKDQRHIGRLDVSTRGLPPCRRERGLDLNAATGRYEGPRCFAQGASLDAIVFTAPSATATHTYRVRLASVRRLIAPG
jgi:hypothetical protein